MITALIMAGGQGTRFWPLSRKDNPKQFLKLTDKKRTMLQDTVERIKPLIPAEQVFIATNKRYKKSILKQLNNVPEGNIIIEPLKRNTAPSIGLSSLYIDKKFPGSNMLVLPSDHLIKDNNRFIELVEKAVMVAASDKNIVTLGIQPTHPETGYGYIHFDKLYKSIDNDNIYKVIEFTEKPELHKAKIFLDKGTYLWNSGMFVWQVGTILENIKIHMPDLYKSLEKIKSNLDSELEEKVIKEEFKKLDSLSIDYGIMENADNIYVIPSDFGWDDLGSWPALERINKTDDNGNVVVGKHYGIDTKDSIIHSTDKVVTTIGMKDVVIVSTKDAILICDKKRAQEVKGIRNILKENGMEDCL